MMGLFDDLGGALGKLTAGAAPGLIGAVLAKTNLGDLSGIVSQLQQGGLGSQVQSWLGNGSNMPVTAEQLKAALGDEHVRQIAEHLGLPVDKALSLLSEHLPAAVDQASPNGKLDEQ